jgi:hypothetical protein
MKNNIKGLIDVYRQVNSIFAIFITITSLHTRNHILGKSWSGSLSWVGIFLFSVTFFSYTVTTRLNVGGTTGKLVQTDKRNLQHWAALWQPNN